MVFGVWLEDYDSLSVVQLVVFSKSATGALRGFWQARGGTLGGFVAWQKDEKCIG